jgi:hypothetical protein
MTKTAAIDNFLDDCFEAAEKAYERNVATIASMDDCVDDVIVRALHHRARRATLSDQPAPVCSTEIGWL